MKPLVELPNATARGLRVLFTDIDDTVSTEGRITAEAYDAIWRLSEGGIAVVPVTGRPAGWCDHIARMWPVAGVVGENGAFYFRYDRETKRLEQRFVLSADERAQLPMRFGDLATQIIAAVPSAAIASDQPYRIHDLAIDFAEDVDPLPERDIDRIVSLFEAAGATAKVSSIHVNGWFGDYDKLGMIRRFATEALGLDLSNPAERAGALYVGDSPNDEPAFAFFENSVGVQNVTAFAARLAHPPAYVTPSAGGAGFAELARFVLTARDER